MYEIVVRTFAPQNLSADLTTDKIMDIVFHDFEGVNFQNLLLCGSSRTDEY